MHATDKKEKTRTGERTKAEEFCQYRESKICQEEQSNVAKTEKP